MKKFRVEKVIKRKGDDLYAKQKNYDNSFNSWINQKPKLQLDLPNYVTKANPRKQQLLVHLLQQKNQFNQFEG